MTGLSAWTFACIVAAAVNSARLTGRVGIVCILALLPWIGVVAGGGAALLPAAALGSIATLLWRRWVIDGGSVVAVAGLSVFALAIGLAFVRLGPADGEPSLILLLAGLLLAEPSTRLLVRGMGLAGKQGRSSPEAPGRGEAIGILERWLLLILVLRGDYTALAFLVAAKSLVRHDRFSKDPDFAEYFLVGTLGSILLAVVVAEGAKWVLSI